MRSEFSYLDSLAPLLSEAELAETTKIVKDFETGQGPSELPLSILVPLRLVPRHSIGSRLSEEDSISTTCHYKQGV